MHIQFIASMAVVSADTEANQKLFVEDLGLPLEDAVGDGYYHSEKIGGSKHFGVWPLAQAAQACFGTEQWPGDRPMPQACVEFEVADPKSVATAAGELVAKGHTLLHEARTEPWGQTVARLQTPDGVIVGLSYAPWMHDTK